MLELSVTAFLDRLASSDPTPGGGSVAALTGAMAAGLGVMVCDLTIGKPKYAEVEADLRSARERLEQLRTSLTGLAEQDAEAYGKLNDAFRQPKDSDEAKQARHDAIQAALVDAVEVPLQVAEASGQVMDFAPVLLQKGNPHASSDAGMTAVLALAALRSAVLNVHINLASMEDSGAAQAARRRLDEAVGSRMQLALSLHHEVLRRIEGGA